MGLGGGGFVEIVLTLEGFHSVLIGFEARVQLAVDFGVASGKIAASLGITFLIEASGKITITAFFRLVGEVDVLGLITASIELSWASKTDAAGDPVRPGLDHGRGRCPPVFGQRDDRAVPGVRRGRRRRRRGLPSGAAQAASGETTQCPSPTR